MRLLPYSSEPSERCKRPRPGYRECLLWELVSLDRGSSQWCFCAKGASSPGGGHGREAAPGVGHRATAASDLSYTLLHAKYSYESLCRDCPPCVSEAEGPSTCRAPGAAGTPNRAPAFCQGPSLPARPHVAKAGGSTRCSGCWVVPFQGSSPPSTGGRGPVHVWCVHSRRTASQPGRSPAAARATCPVPSFGSAMPALQS